MLTRDGTCPPCCADLGLPQPAGAPLLAPKPKLICPQCGVGWSPASLMDRIRDLFPRRT